MIIDRTIHNKTVLWIYDCLIKVDLKFNNRNQKLILMETYTGKQLYIIYCGDLYHRDQSIFYFSSFFQSTNAKLKLWYCYKWFNNKKQNEYTVIATHWEIIEYYLLDL